jgi:hypothetical protein
MTLYLYLWRAVVIEAYLADNYWGQDYGELPETEDGDGKGYPCTRYVSFLLWGCRGGRGVGRM